MIMKKITLGILAHVDSGKTTLSEAMLYQCGKIRALGRVDKKNTFLDTGAIEKERGITIFSKQAVMEYNDMRITLIDTPGHVDFGAETERVLDVLDCALLVISAADGITSHTETLWRLLERYNIPTFVFVNKTDLPNPGKAAFFDEINTSLCGGFCDFSDDCGKDFYEELSMFDENIMEEFLEKDTVSKENIISAVYSRKIFPCLFGSALHLDGVDKVLDCICKYTNKVIYPDFFGAKVFKISEDEQKNRLTFMKITGGSIGVKNVISHIGEDGEKYDEKINQIRIYSGAGFQTTDIARAGDVCAVTGLSKSYEGEGLGEEEDTQAPSLESVFSYKVIINDGIDFNYVLSCFKKLSEEDKALKCRFDTESKEININLMGEIQSEILRRMIKDRFDMDVEFEESGVVYKETIISPVEGVGHYEPLRHYAEVHLLLEPLERGTGLLFDTKCGDDVLDRHFQRLILTHLGEKTHLGVLTGSPITDMKITLYSGKSHNKHTEGGDFRQATYRAVRHGLRCAESILLEPWYDFSAIVPVNNAGRLMTDISNMGGSFDSPYTEGNICTLKGRAPAKALRMYQRELIGYTAGSGKMALSFSGYDICKNWEYVVSDIGYNADSDVANTADSVFCSHGAGFVVKWDKVTEYMHLESIFKKKSDDTTHIVNVRKTDLSDSVENEAEILKIYENTYGKIQKKTDGVRVEKKKITSPASHNYKGKPKVYDGQYLLVDGYNIIFAWDELKTVAKDSLELARKMLCDTLSNFASLSDEKVIVVFDAYKVKGGMGSVEQEGNITVVYTKEAETADTYIEKVSHTLSKNNLVRVATSDGMEQIIIIGSGAFRVSAENFLKEVKIRQEEIRRYTDYRE